VRPLPASHGDLEGSRPGDLVKARPYQVDLIAAARLKLREIKDRLQAQGLDRGPRLLIQCPTGGGKTVIAGTIMKALVDKQATPARFLCHRDFLVDQTSKTYATLGLDHSFMAAGKWFNQFSPVHVGMVQTVKARLAKYSVPKWVMWDEAHHIGAASWSKIMEEWDSATHIGFTATPCRLDGKGLDAFFDDIVLGPSVGWLISQGYLSDYVAYAPSSPDLTGLHTRMGDYIASEVDEVMDKAVVIGDMVRDYQQYAPGRRAVYFCASIKHSEHVAASFNAAGIPARHLDGTHKTWERNQAAMQFADGDLQVLTNVDLFGEGYDLAAQAGRDVTIECVGLARPTQSLGLFMQQVGRALRPKADKAIILDHAGNISKHGLPDDDREWGLAGRKKAPGNASTVRQCSECFAMIPVMKMKCPECGFVKKAEAVGAREVNTKDGDLHEIDKDAIRKSRKLEEWQCSTLEELIDLGRRRGYSDPIKWAGFMWTSKKKRALAKEHAAKQQLDFYEKVMR
jgi:DNA repair protein RadD